MLLAVSITKLISSDNMIRNSHIPTSITKQLKIASVGDHRKLRVSSNFLPMFGFGHNTRIKVDAVGNGVKVTADTNGTQKIYGRTYKQRKNNPFETVLELPGAAVMKQFPSYIERFHIEMRTGELFLRPIANMAFSIRSALRKLENPMQMFAALTSGIDIHAAASLGFEIKGIVEYRPNEARDKSDLTETGILTALANNKVGHVFNEDIYQLDWRNVANVLDMPHVPVVHASLQCDHFSNVCPSEFANSYDIKTTRDMFIPFLEGIKTLQPAVVVIEQVAGFHTSTEWQLLAMQLRRMGYHINAETMDARDYGGLTSRSRMHAVCSIFPDFKMPASTPRRTESIWDEVIAPHLADCRDVTHSKAIQDGARVGRLRVINKSKPHSPTPIKSQDRMAKDTLVIEHNGRYLMPSEDLLKALLSIPSDFNLNIVGKTIATEVIGQSVDYGMHKRLLNAVKEHILTNIGRCSVSNVEWKGQAELCL